MGYKEMPVLTAGGLAHPQTSAYRGIIPLRGAQATSLGPG
jgi:hypothetical protein